MDESRPAGADTPAAPAAPPPYRDPARPVGDRVRDLLGRMTLREKVRQMDQYHGCQNFAQATFPTHHTAMAKGSRLREDRFDDIIGPDGIGCIHDLYPPDAQPTNVLQRYAVEKTRLGIPILFSEEGLHGLCGPGNTVFPQAIAMAGTWNPGMVRRVGRGIARELRAYGIHETFSPVIDVCREPRWGRMEETYGEDMWLSARMAVAMVRGLQGDSLAADDAVVAEPKHFAAYGIPRGGVNCSPALVGERELRTEVLRVFEAAFREGGARSAMCSYNSIDAVPASGDHGLLTGVLRGEWGFEGFVRSDLGAVRRLDWAHFTAADGAEAIIQSVAAGLDMQYYDYESAFYQQTLMDAVGDGRLSEAAIDRAVAAILGVKFELGLFENPYTDASLFARRVRCPEHADIALDCAREALCLMKNDGNLLPLPKDLTTIAVVGPGAAEARMGDYTPTIWGFEPVTVLDGIRALAGSGTEVRYARGTGTLAGELVPVPPRCLLPPEGEEGDGLRGEYFANTGLEGPPATVRHDAAIDFNWAFTKAAESVPPTAFSVRWTGRLVPDETFDGYLGTSSLDSMRLWVGDDLLTDGWDRGKNANTNLSRPFRFEAGRAYPIRVEYKRDHSAIQVRLGWNHGADDLQEAVDAAAGADVAIVCVGDSRETCGEGRDRAYLHLPGNQGDLVRAVHATGTPVVLVLQIGRALALRWEAAHVPAILNAWFPGEQGGRAIAEALFGDYSPGGRLPVTFPRAEGQLPIYYSALPHGRQGYIDEETTPLFAFGHGLSYTTFAYENLRVEPGRIPPDGEVRVAVDVVNTGDRPGDEVAQLYLRDCVSSVVRPRKELRGFERIHLAPGERRTVRFELGFEHLKLLNRRMEWAVEPGEFEVFVGGNLDDTVSARFTVE